MTGECCSTPSEDCHSEKQLRMHGRGLTDIQLHDIWERSQGLTASLEVSHCRRNH